MLDSDLGLEQDGSRRDAVSVFRYVRDVVRHQGARTVLNVDKYDTVIWLHELLDMPGCHIAFERSDHLRDDQWVTVSKRLEPRVPELPKELRQWVAPGTGLSEQLPPTLASQILRSPGQADAAGDEAGTQSEWIQVSDYPSVKSQFDRYTKGPWQQWVEEHREWLRFHDSAYSPLFRLHQKLSRLGEEYELVLGMGCFAWSGHAEGPIRRHMVTVRASLYLDVSTGDFCIQASPDDGDLGLELDMLPSTVRPTKDVFDHAQTLLRGAEGNPRESDAIDGAIRAVINSLDGDYSAAKLAPDMPSVRPQASLAPAIILRKRNSAGRVAFFDKVVVQLEQGIALPECIERLVSDEQAENSGRSSAHVKKDDFGFERPYFPLPANDDQLQIAERVSRTSGVLVQGPPGTGKSHTITNLLCHLLACGKRVLVTAQTPRALEVLRDKLRAVPGDGDMADLCVSMVGDDRASQNDLERSIANIIERKDRWDTASDSAIRDLEEQERELKALESQRDLLRLNLRSLAEADAEPNDAGEFAKGQTLQKISQLTHARSEQFGWMEDRPAITSRLTISEVHLENLRSLSEAIPADIAIECAKFLPNLGGDYPAGSVLVSLLRTANAGEPKFAKSRRPARHDEQAVEAHAHTFAAVNSLATGIRTTGFLGDGGWQRVAIGDMIAGKYEHWKQLLESTNVALARLEPDLSLITEGKISLPRDKSVDEIRADVNDLIDHLVTKRRSLGIWIFRPAVVRRTAYLMSTCIVDGKRPADGPALQQLARHLAARATLDGCWAEWSGITSDVPSTEPRKLAALKSLAADLAKITSLVPTAEAVRVALRKTYSDALPRIIDPESIFALSVDCSERYERVAFWQATDVLESAAERLAIFAVAQNAHELHGKLASAIASRNLSATELLLSELCELSAHQNRISEQAIAIETIGSQLPKLAARIAAEPSNPVWSDRFATLGEAYQWAQAKSWLSSIIDIESRPRITDELRSLETRILGLTGRIAANRAWRSCFTAMSEAHRRGLVQWQQAIAKLGKGTGIYAGKWRRAAQSELEKCKDAIPAWVMPLYRVFETVPPTAGLFDVVIVDEASQCGIDALGLLYIGKRVIVVGDNEQISPSNVGVNRDDMAQILKTNLGQMPSQQSFDIDNSLFDHAARLFDSRVTLREHFRCVPDIIRFSNNLSYGGKLIPLRQFPAKHLAPLVMHYVPHGTTSGVAGRKFNANEADDLVSAVLACCQDPLYEGKTMGVISLLGAAQAAYIERQLLRLLGAEEMVKRRIICGDAYSFQGDERHVIFMSLVAAPSANGSRGYVALTGRADKQRFNVAASRAQDQCWLFHSITPSDISNSDCVRRRLLTHFYDPARSVAESDGIKLEELRRQASDSRRSESVPLPFDSWFEVDVYLRIVDRGFPTRVQYPAGEFRIDLVIEGATRLAVECDGDRWHGPDRFDADMRRQRQLERAGWQFWRVSGSAFYHDPDLALASLWQRLSSLGISPSSKFGNEVPRGGHVAKFDVQLFVAPEPQEEREPAEDLFGKSLPRVDSLSDPADVSSRVRLDPIVTPSHQSPDIAEMKVLQNHLRTLWKAQGKSDRAVPNSKVRLLQLIEDATGATAEAELDAEE